MDPETVIVCFIVGMFGGAIISALVVRWLVNGFIFDLIGRSLKW